MDCPFKFCYNLTITTENKTDTVMLMVDRLVGMQVGRLVGRLGIKTFRYIMLVGGLVG